MRIVSKNGLVALMAIAPMALAATSLSAQEQDPENLTQCVATVSTDQTSMSQQQQDQGIQSGERAARVTFTLTGSVGNISDFSAEKREGMETPTNPQQEEQALGQEKGDDLKLAEGDDLPATQREMAASGEQENEAIQMSTQNSVTLWLNSEDASAGTYHFTLEGENGECTGQIEVKDRGYQR